MDVAWGDGPEWAACDDVFGECRACDAWCGPWGVIALCRCCYGRVTDCVDPGWTACGRWSGSWSGLFKRVCLSKCSVWLILTKIIYCLVCLSDIGSTSISTEVPGECIVSELGLDCSRESICPNLWNEPSCLHVRFSVNFYCVLMCLRMLYTVQTEGPWADVACGVWLWTVCVGLFVLMLGVNPIIFPYFFLFGSSVRFSFMLMYLMNVVCVADGIDPDQTSGAGLLARIYPCECLLGVLESNKQ